MEAQNPQQHTKDKVPRVQRPCAFDKMEGLVRKMQDTENGVPVGSQKQFLTSIPSAFMGYDLIEWLMDRLSIEETEAVHLANQLCQYGYFFPVNDSKTLAVKDDSSLYRFQIPYYWPWQHRTPDNVEYAIYLAKRTLRNKQRHALEDYEVEALNSLRKNLSNKWEIIQGQAEEQVRLFKDRKKGDKIVSDSQERAFWRVYRPPPGYMSSLEVPPVPTRVRPGTRPPIRKRTLTDIQREVELLRNSLTRTRIKVSVAIDNLKTYFNTYMDYDPMIVPPQPSNPWITDDHIFWQFNSPLVDIPTDKRVKRWSISLEELMSDPTGLQEFTNYLRKEYSHENIRFWLAVKDLRHCFQAQIPEKVIDIYREFLAPGAPCEINIDGKTMDKILQEMKNPSRFTFDAAAEHVYTLLLKKDCYPRFIRSDHYRNLLAAGVQPQQKKRFFTFGGQGKKKAVIASTTLQQGNISSGGRRRGSDRSLSGSAHELAVCGVRDVTSTPRVPHSHSQSNLTDIPYRGDLACLVNISSKPSPHSIQDAGVTEIVAARPMDDVCPWDTVAEPDAVAGTSSGSTDESTYWPYTGPGIPLPQETSSRTSRKNSSQLDSYSSSSDVSIAIAEASERLKKSCLQHSTSIAVPSRNYPPIVSSGKIKLSEISRSSSTFVTTQQSFDQTLLTTISTTTTATNTTTTASVITQLPLSLSLPLPLALPLALSASSSSSSATPSSSSQYYHHHHHHHHHYHHHQHQKQQQQLQQQHSYDKTTPSSNIMAAILDTVKLSVPEENESLKNDDDDDDDGNGDDNDKNDDNEDKIESSEDVEGLNKPSLNVMAPLISISSIVGDLTGDSEKSINESVIEEKEKEMIKCADGDGDNTIEQESDDKNILIKEQTVEDSQVVPVWTPVNEPTASTSSSVPQQQTDNNVNEVCPWEDEENCRVDTPYVKTYATLGYL